MNIIKQPTTVVNIAGSNCHKNVSSRFNIEYAVSAKYGVNPASTPIKKLCVKYAINGAPNIYEIADNIA